MALDLAKQGITRQEIAIRLYPSSEKKSGLSGLRKLMERRGYVWNEKDSNYQLIADSIKFNNKQEVEEKIIIPNNTAESVPMKPSELVSSQEIDRVNLSVEDRSLLQELIKALTKQSEAFEGHVGERELNPLNEGFTDFESHLYNSSMQLHSEVKHELDDFCKKYKVSKKVVVNEAIWQFLKKWGV